MALPALSSQVGALERELDVQLLLRHSRGTELTPAGRHLLAHAVDLIGRFDAVKASTMKFSKKAQLEVNIGLPTTVTEILAVPLIEGMRGAHPHVKLHIIEGMTGHLERWLEQDELAVAILDHRSKRSSRDCGGLCAMCVMALTKNAIWAMLAGVALASARGLLPA